MKRSVDKLLRMLLWPGLPLIFLALTVRLSFPAAVFAADEISGEQPAESPVTDVISTTLFEETPAVPEQSPDVPEVTPAAPEQIPEVPEEVPAAPEQSSGASEEIPPAPEQISETSEEAPAVPEQGPDVPEIAPAIPKQDPVAPEVTPAAPQQNADVPEVTPAAPQQNAELSEKNAVAKAEAAFERPDRSDQASEDAPKAEVTVSDNTGPSSSDTNSRSSAAGDGSGCVSNTSSAGTIRIGEVSFNADEEESSCWSDGKGWKNVAGQYIAMVDYDGSKAEISADGAVITLAVAGINRIRTIRGDCSVQIIGSGIVLIDNIDIAEGKALTLHTNTALYTEGSAAVFVRQEDGSYMLINGGVAGILDEEYILDNVRLTLPDCSSLILGSRCVRTETWLPEGAEHPVTDVTHYTEEVPWGAKKPVHQDGTVRISDYGARVVIGENSSLTVGSRASVRLMEVKDRSEAYTGYMVEAELIVNGNLTVNGVVEGGFVEVRDGGLLSGSGTIRSADVHLRPAGSLSDDLLLEGGTLTVYGTSHERLVSPRVKDEILYLEGYGITLPELAVSGHSVLTIGTGDFYSSAYKIGNITLSPGSSLDIVAADHDFTLNNDWQGFPYRLLEDCRLEIYGKITGGTVSVLAGCVNYTGTQTDVLPVVPDGFASRVLVAGSGASSTEYPLSMTQAEASARAAKDQIPVMGFIVFETLLSEDGEIAARSWVVDTKMLLDPLSRENDKNTNIPDLLRKYHLLSEDDKILSEYYVAVEVIYSDLTRVILWYNESYSISLDNAIMVRILQCYWHGGAGGSSASHVSTAFTGSGVLGGLGAGSVQAGIGSVVYGKPADPQQDDPQQDDPHQDDPHQDDPKQDDPKQDDPKQNDPKQDDRKPADQKTIKEKTVSRRSGNTGRNTAAAPVGSRNSSAGAARDAGVDRLVAAVSAWEPAKDEVTGALSEDRAVKGRKLPEIWSLSVTRAGVPVEDLDGQTVEVVFEFTIPDSWGSYEPLAGERLYAVFVDDEGELKAFEALYDPELGVIRFETDRTGYFVIVKFAHEEGPAEEAQAGAKPAVEAQAGTKPAVEAQVGAKPAVEEAAEEETAGNDLFTEEFYRELAQEEEVQAFLEVLKEEGLLDLSSEQD